MRLLAAAAFHLGEIRVPAGLEKQANLVKGGMSKPLFSPVPGQAGLLTLQTGEKPPKNGGKLPLNGEILD
jgi:hypothetical protein